MKQTRVGLSQRYVAALRKHLRKGSHPIPPVREALGLGRQAVALGLKTPELARVHGRALATLKLSDRGLLQRAEIFFAQAKAPIEEPHRAARRSKVHLSRLKTTLSRRTQELSDTDLRLQRGIFGRKNKKDVCEKPGKAQARCLEESLQLQKLLRQLTHKVLAAQEDERTKISHELQDEIAQTLLGINVRLLSLKQKARINAKGLKNDIATTQRLVIRSAKSVRRFARELGTHQQT